MLHGWKITKLGGDGTRGTGASEMWSPIRRKRWHVDADGGDGGRPPAAMERKGRPRKWTANLFDID